MWEQKSRKRAEEYPKRAEHAEFYPKFQFPVLSFLRMNNLYGYPPVSQAHSTLFLRTDI